MTEKHYDAELQFERFTGVGGGKKIAWGTIYNDKKGRFRDGTQVRTSIVESDGDGYIQTMNTCYKVI